MFNLKRHRSYRDKVALVTGAAGGLGRALCRELGRAGARLGLMDLDTGELEHLARSLQGDGVQCTALPGDITDRSYCDAAVAETVARFDGLDVLINNAGLTQRSAFADTDVEVFRKVMEVNYFGSLHCTKAAMPQLLERGGQIIVISSIAGFSPLYGRSGYSASKHALHGLFDSLRSELLQTGVGVLVACPGVIDTDFANRALDADGSPPPPPPPLHPGPAGHARAGGPGHHQGRRPQRGDAGALQGGAPDPAADPRGARYLPAPHGALAAQGARAVETYRLLPVSRAICFLISPLTEARTLPERESRRSSPRSMDRSSLLTWGIGSFGLQTRARETDR